MLSNALLVMQNEQFFLSILHQKPWSHLYAKNVLQEVSSTYGGNI